MYIGQGSSTRFVGSWISFLDSFFFSGKLFWRMESINVAGVLQKAGDADSKGPHQIPSVSWRYHHSLHFHIYQIALFVPGIQCPWYCNYKWWGDVIGEGGWWWLLYNRVWEEGQWVGIILQFFCFSSILLVLLSFVLLCPQYLCFKWLEHDRCCVCFFGFYFFSLSLAPLARSYWCIEIVASVM